MISKIAGAALLTAFVSVATVSVAHAGPQGVWIDHTGRGAVEISNCGGGLCGRLVWLKSAKNNSACGMRIIGNAKPVGGGKWDNGWILDPDAGSRYKVEITPMGSKLKVMGYAGSKMLSQTMIWRRAPSDIKRCA